MLWSEFIEYLSKLVRYIKLHGGHTKFLGGKYYVHTREIRKGATRDTSIKPIKATN